jgi:hypothetical protein
MLLLWWNKETIKVDIYNIMLLLWWNKETIKVDIYNIMLLLWLFYKIREILM